MAVSCSAATPSLTGMKMVINSLSFTKNFVAAPMLAPPLTGLSQTNGIPASTSWKHPRVAQGIGRNCVERSRKSAAVGALVSSEVIGLLNEGHDGPSCPGCGILMQNKDPNLPGYYCNRKVSLAESEAGSETLWDEELEQEEEVFVDSIEDELGESDGEDYISEFEDGIDMDMSDWEAKWGSEDDELKELDGFAPAGVGYGNITEETLEMEKKMKKRLSKAERKRMARVAKKEKEEVTVCARCHSLRNYGLVKNQVAENLIPDFDFDRLFTTKLTKPTGSADATVVVMVVDCVDFDGSFPKRAAKSLFKALEGNKAGARASNSLPKLVLVATKVDLLPSQISPTRLDRWVRRRAKAAGAPKLSRVYLVSARKDVGVRNLLSFIKELAGPRGNVWIVGAQNAGKSTLINAFANKEGVKITKLTEAAVPGTTLGILRIGGILSAKAKLYDTPGLLHPCLISMRLNREEQKLSEIRKELKPRTYRMKVGQTVHVGGLMRLDLCQASVETIYVTIWASSNVSLHMGRTENVDEIFRKHVGVRLQPPIGMHRAPEIGKWVERKFNVSGNSWDVNAIDIAAAGLGWFSVGLKGQGTVTLWTYNGIEISLREPLVLDRAPFLERPGFWLPKALSEAIGCQTKLEASARKKLQENSAEELAKLPA